GLLKSYDFHRVTAWDGLIVLDYQEPDGRYPSAAIYEPGKGYGNKKFDPRSLGLTPVMTVNLSPEAALGFAHVKSIEIVGKESVNEVLCWDVRSQFEHGSGHTWIDVEHPTRVIKHVSDSYTVLSKYDESDPKSPIPREVRITDTPNGSLRYTE